MPLIPINCTGTHLALARPGTRPGVAPDEHIRAALADLPQDAPVIVMIHGYRYSARHPRSCPHNHILSLTPSPATRNTPSWPRHLGFGAGASGPHSPPEGLCIAFGWEARGTLWQAYAEAARAAAGLARLVDMIRAARPATRVNVLAHSLGARVLLSALPGIPAAGIGRAVLLAAAEFQAVAQACVATPAGHTAEIINVTTRENDLFDLAVELLLPGRGSALGQGLGQTAPNWLEMRVDQPATLFGLASLGHRVAPPGPRICHWSGYLRAGLFPLYQVLLRDPERLALADLRVAVPDTGPQPRLRLTDRLMPGFTLRNTDNARP